MATYPFLYQLTYCHLWPLHYGLWFFISSFAFSSPFWSLHPPSTSCLYKCKTVLHWLCAGQYSKLRCYFRELFCRPLQFICTLVSDWIQSHMEHSTWCSKFMANVYLWIIIYLLFFNLYYLPSVIYFNLLIVFCIYIFIFFSESKY